MSNGHNKRFLANPFKYLKEVTVVPNDGLFNGSKASVFRGNGLPAEMRPHDMVYLDLVEIDGDRIVRTDFYEKPPGGDEQIVGGYVPYIQGGTVNANPQTMGRHNLPPPGGPKFEFTGALNGCSLILCSGETGQVAVHYPNSDCSTLGYPHLNTLKLVYIKSIDYFKTQGGSQENYSDGLLTGSDTYAAMVNLHRTTTGFFNAFAFMMNIGGVWHLIAQPTIAEMRPQKGKFTARKLHDFVKV